MKTAFQAIILIIILMIAAYWCFSYFSPNNIKNLEITKNNYQQINKMVQNSDQLDLQEKTNFQKNYFLFGEKIIGYKVRDVIKKIEF